MKKAKPYLPLLILGLIQVGTAIFFMLPDFIVEAFGFKTVSMDLSVYLYVVCALYFSLGVLYIMGAIMTKIRLSALVIACINIPLEVVSYWVGFPQMLLPYWLIFLFSIIIATPCVCCLFHLKMHYNMADYK